MDQKTQKMDERTVVSETIDVAVISKDLRVNSFLTTFCEENDYGLEVWESDETFSDFCATNTKEIKLIIISAVEADERWLGQAVQVASQMCAGTFIACVISAKLSREAAAFIIKCGARAILKEDELSETSKIPFIFHNIVRERYIPLKIGDIDPGKELLFNLYHYAPQRNKYLVCGAEGMVLTPAKYELMKKYGEFYVRRDDIEKFEKYMATVGLGGSSLQRRCRAQYLALRKNFADLVIHLTDYGQCSSFKEGKAILDRCNDISNRLVLSLVEVKNIWDIVNLRKMKPVVLEDIPALVAYAGIFALRMDQMNVDEISVSALLCDLGLVMLPRRITEKVIAKRFHEMSKDERALYQTHMDQSVKIVLESKMPLQQNIRHIIAHTHERADATGFPRAIRGEKIPIEAFIIGFAEECQRMSEAKMGENLQNVEEFYSKIMSEQEIFNRFRPSFVGKLKTILAIGK